MFKFSCKTHSIYTSNNVSFIYNNLILAYLINPQIIIIYNESFKAYYLIYVCIYSVS